MKAAPWMIRLRPQFIPMRAFPSAEGLHHLLLVCFCLRGLKTSPGLLSPGFGLIIHPMVCRGSALLHLPPASTRLSFSAKPLLELWPRTPSPCASFQTLPVSIICNNHHLVGHGRPDLRWLLLLLLITITIRIKGSHFSLGRLSKPLLGWPPLSCCLLLGPTRHWGTFFPHAPSKSLNRHQGLRHLS